MKMQTYNHVNIGVQISRTQANMGQVWARWSDSW